MHGVIAMGKQNISADGKSWYAVQCYSRCEIKVKEEVEELEFPCFCPMGSRTKIIRQRRVIVHDPIFTGYVFVAFDRERDYWGQIKAVDGVIDILSNGHLPVAVPKDLIDRLMRAQDAGVFDWTKPGAAFTVNDEVEVVEGPFAGLIAKIKSATAKKRIKILLQGLTLDIDPCFLRKVA